MTNLNPEATVTVIGKIRNFFGNSRLPKANKSDNTLVFSISKSQGEANIQIAFDKELTPEQIKEIERITNGDVNKFFKNEKINKILKDVKVDEVIVTKFVGKKVSLFPKHAGKVTFKNCTFKDNSQIYIQDNDVTFDGCTFGDGVSIHSLNENANVTIKDSKLPKKIGASVKQEQRILDRKRALKFFGKFKGLTLQNNYDEERNGEKILGGLIDAGVAEIINNGEKQPILFKDNNGQLINSKLILKLYGGSLIKKSNLGQELYAAQIEAKKNDLISQNKADTNTSDEEIETHCIISKDEKILRSVSLVDDTFEYEKSLKREALRSEKKDKKRALESLEETRKSVAKSAYNEIKLNHKKLNHKKLMADYKQTLPKVTAQTHDEMNEEEKKSFSKKYEGKISYEKKVKKFFKKQFKKLKRQVDASNNDTTASGTPTSKSTDAQISTDSQPTQNNGSNSDPTQDPVTSNSANGEQYTDSDTQNQDQNQTLDLNTNEAQNADTTTNNTQASNAADAQSTNAASDEQFASQANDDDTELNNDEEESDTPSNNGNIPDEESTETEEEKDKALKNPDKISNVSAGTSDMENEQKEENNNQETTSSN